MLHVFTIRRTDVFAKWLDSLADVKGRACVLARIERLSMGHAGDAKSVGDGVSELRIDFGPGYRVYFAKVGRGNIVLLAGGDKSSQARDVRAAIRLARDLEDI